MKIELKKISFFERMSEETNCFAADLYINGKKVGVVKNDGQGGCTDYHGDSIEHNQIIRQAEQYCKTLPKVKYNELEFEQSLEHVINTLFEDYITAKETAKFNKKMAKQMANAILIGVPNSGKYHYFKQNKPLSTYPKEALQNWVNAIKEKHCKDGVVILNTNLTELGLTV